MRAYCGLITLVDTACEEKYLYLEEQHLLDTTMIIFITDNGFIHGAHT